MKEDREWSHEEQRMRSKEQVGCEPEDVSDFDIEQLYKFYG